MTKAVETVHTGVIERVQALVEEVLVGTPYFIVELDIRGARGSQSVAIYLDSDEPLSIDAIAKLSKEISFLLETEEVIDGRYRLSVSSPGVDRPLKLPRQYKKNVGRTLRIRHQKEDGKGLTETLGDLAAAHDDAIEVALKGGQRRRIQYHDIEWAKVQLPW